MKRWRRRKEEKKGRREKEREKKWRGIRIRTRIPFLEYFCGKPASVAQMGEGERSKKRRERKLRRKGEGRVEGKEREEVSIRFARARGDCWRLRAPLDQSAARRGGNLEEKGKGNEGETGRDRDCAARHVIFNTLDKLPMIEPPCV